MTAGLPTDFGTRYLARVDSLVDSRPHLKLLQVFLKDEKWGNEACRDREYLERDVKVLGLTATGWVYKAQDLDNAIFQPMENANRHVIVLNYLDCSVISILGEMFNIDPDFFYSHLAGCEQHHSGTWYPSELTSPPPLLSTRLQAPYIVLDFRRPYALDIDESNRLEKRNEFDDWRIQTCTILRSFHETMASPKIFAHERFSVTRKTDTLLSWGPTGIFCHAIFIGLSADVFE